MWWGLGPVIHLLKFGSMEDPEDLVLSTNIVRLKLGLVPQTLVGRLFR
jgi:hypothetical protein